MAEKKSNLDYSIIPISLHVTISHNNPALELRKIVTDLELCKILIESCLYDKPVLVFPSTANKLLFSNSLIEKGIMHRDKDKRLVFNF